MDYSLNLIIFLLVNCMTSGYWGESARENAIENDSRYALGASPSVVIRAVRGAERELMDSDDRSR